MPRRSTISTAAVLAAATASLLAQPGGAAAAPGRSAAHTTVISVPMTVGRSRLSVSNALTPQAYVPGNCETAFLYLARVNGNQTRATYGFQYLTHRAVGYTAGAEFHNEDTGAVVVDRASGTLAYRSSFERAVTKTTGSGVVVVFAHLHSVGVLYDCYSSPALRDSIYVY